MKEKKIIQEKKYYILFGLREYLREKSEMKERKNMAQNFLFFFSTLEKMREKYYLVFLSYGIMRDSRGSLE